MHYNKSQKNDHEIFVSISAKHIQFLGKVMNTPEPISSTNGTRDDRGRPRISHKRKSVDCIKYNE